MPAVRRPGGGAPGETRTVHSGEARLAGADSSENPRTMDRFDKFTDRARKVLTLAQDEAQRFNHNYIGTEHLLLGLIREGEGVAARVLEAMGADLERVRSQVVYLLGEEGTASYTKQASKPPPLDGFGRALPRRARENNLDRVIGGGREIGGVIRVLSRRT